MNSEQPQSSTTINQIKQRITATKRKFSELKESLENDLRDLAAFESDQQTLHEKIKLNIGGKVFVTTRSTLTNEPDTFFSVMFSGNFDETPDEDGEYFIDRNPRFFELILDHLRGVDIQPNLNNLSEEDLHLFSEEAKFYQIQDLIEDDELDWSLDPRLCSRSIQLSDEFLTATKKETTHHKSPPVVVGSRSFSKGKHVWEITINSMAASYTQQNRRATGFTVGIIEQENLSMNFTAEKYKRYGHWCSNNPLVSHEMTGIGGNWKEGTVLRMELDFDEGTFKIMDDESPTRIYCLGNIKGTSWYPFFILPKMGDSLTLETVE